MGCHLVGEIAEHGEAATATMAAIGKLSHSTANIACRPRQCINDPTLEASITVGVRCSLATSRAIDKTVSYSSQHMTLIETHSNAEDRPFPHDGRCTQGVLVTAPEHVIALEGLSQRAFKSVCNRSGARRCLERLSQHAFTT